MYDIKIDDIISQVNNLKSRAQCRECMEMTKLKAGAFKSYSCLTFKS